MLTRTHRLRRSLAVGALTAATALAPALPAAAAPEAPPAGSAPAAPAPAAPAARTPAPAGLPVGDAGGQRIVLDRDVRPVAPGLDLTSFAWLDARGFVRGDALVADLGTDGLSGDYLFPGEVAQSEPLSAQAERRGAVAAVNGDFFDINASSAPLGAGLSRDGLVKSPVAGWENVVGVDTAGLGRMTKLFLEGEVRLPGGGTARLDGVNQHRLPLGGIGAYTSVWGSYPRTDVAPGSARLREVHVAEGRVTAVAEAPGTTAVPAGATALVGSDAGADALAGLRVGDEVALSYAPRTDDGELAFAVGGNTVLLRDGVVQPQGDEALAPRTAVGFDADGGRMFLVTVDGRMRESRGLSYEELGAFLKELGADDALNLDGGGSSTLLAREAGEDGVDVENEPSDGAERPVPNGLALFAEDGSGRVTGLRVVSEADEEDEAQRRVFPGLTRELEALGHDETWAPVDADARYRVRPGRVGFVDADGTFTAERSGDAQVVARGRAGSTGSLAVTVLGPLVRTTATVDKVMLPDADATGTFGIVGHDRDGFTAPIEPRDVRLSYDTSQLRIVPDGEGGFRVEARAPEVATVVTATVRGVTMRLPVSVGQESLVVADFSDAASWRFGTARGAGSVAPAAGRDGGPALSLSYDFSLSTATRTAYAIAPTPLALPGQPLAVGAWVEGKGQGEWTAFTVVDAEGKAQSLYGPFVTWTGWRYLEVPVPQTMAFPVTVTRFYTIETSASRSYTGSVLVDDITVKVAPRVDVPPAPRVRAPHVVQDGAIGTDGRRWRFAVVSDAQFTAADQSLVPAARRTLREALAADPDFIVVNGDWVDTGYPADMALARKVLDEELGDRVPWYYVPGNHEAYGPGNLAAFTAEFGATHRTFDHEGTRFVLLDSSLGTLRAGGFDQWRMLRSALDGAAEDPAVNGVVAMWHHPPRDPSPLRNSQMTDREEAEVVEEWLADFRRTTGKGAAHIGSHVGSFSAASVDGVAYVVNGNAGKAPSTLPADGGFSGWSLVGIDPDAAPAPAATRHRAAPEARAERPWFQVEMRPHVDALALDDPGTLVPGGSRTVRAHVTQGTRTFPVAYPVSADWQGAAVHIGTPATAGRGDVAAYDPATGTITALRPGGGTLGVVVNGVLREVPVRVAR